MRFVAAILVAVLAFAGVAEAGTKAGPGVVGRYHRLGPGPGAVLAGAGLDYNFQTGQYFQSGATPGVTVARASSKSCDDQAGNFTTVGNNLLCATNKGALIEEARTNSVRTSDMTGAVVGSPGTLPNNWQIVSASGVVTSVSALLTVNGVNTVNLTFTGTTNATFYVACFEQFNTIAAAAAQVWAESFSAARVGAGSGNIAGYNIDIRQQGTGATYDTVFAPTTTLIRYNATATLTAGATFVVPCLYLTFANGVTLNDTLQIGWPQLELGSFATSPIRTTNAAATRAADVVTVTTPPAFGSAYTLFAQGTPNAPVSFGSNQAALEVDDGTANNRAMLIRQPVTGQFNSILVVGGVSQAVPAGGGLWGVSGKMSMALAAADQAQSFAGGAATTAATTPIFTPNAVSVGARQGGTLQWNGYLERIALWPTTRLPNATLQSLTQ